MKDKMSFPPYEAWITDPDVDSNKLLTITAVGILSADYNITEEAAYDYIVANAVNAAKHFGYEVSKRSV
jgi:hypothetical protein